MFSCQVLNIISQFYVWVPACPVFPEVWNNKDCYDCNSPTFSSFLAPHSSVRDSYNCIILWETTGFSYTNSNK